MNETKTRTKARAGPQKVSGNPRRQRFMVDKYEVVAEPLHGSTHMQRYSIFFEGRCIGTQVSTPSKSDCLYLEKPPPVPPVKVLQVAYRPGRPRKGTAPAAAAPVSEERGHIIPREDLPRGAPIRELAKTEDA